VTFTTGALVPGGAVVEVGLGAVVVGAWVVDEGTAVVVVGGSVTVVLDELEELDELVEPADLLDDVAPPATRRLPLASWFG
jgi:hypothetical protein